MGLVANCLAFIFVGFLQEVFVVIYHRATACDRKILAAIMTMLITSMGLLVMAHITHQILAYGGLISFIYVAIFAAGKGVGAYATISLWEKRNRSLVKPDATTKLE